MPTVRATRAAQEILGSAPSSAAVTRQGLQVAFQRPGTNSAATAAVVRASQEVLASAAETLSVTRQGLQVAFSRPSANSAAVARVVRAGHEVLAQVPASVSVTRQGVQAAFVRPGANIAATARVARTGFEVLARSFIPMTSFSVPADFVLLLHNWASGCRIESSYRTDVTSAAESLAEERTGLIQKPYRSMTVEWQVAGNAEANELLVEMRRLVDATSVVPVYCDAVELTASASAGASTIYGDFSKGRWFQNGPILIVRLTPVPNGGATRVQSWETAVVNTKFNDRLVLAAPISTSSPASRTVVLPLMQTHPHATLEFVHETSNVITVSATFDEIYGPTALPPTASDLPDGFSSYAGLPILSTGPQWDQGIDVEFVREGELSAHGRGRLIFQRGARHRVVHKLRFAGYRDEIWPLVQFFDTRRGRLSAFWLIDRDDVFSVSLISGAFLTVSVLGDLTDFQAEMDYVGVQFKDGTTAVRRATVIQLVAGAWRITLDDALPAGYTAADVELFGRARVCRMREDSLSEEWETTNVCRLEVPAIELLAEGEVAP